MAFPPISGQNGISCTKRCTDRILPNSVVAQFERGAEDSPEFAAFVTKPKGSCQLL
jgi:hypothetical protein